MRKKLGGVKCYNLLEQDCVKPYYVKTNEAAKRSTTRVGNKAYRHIFTEEETFSIARMTAKLVVTKYSVSTSIASVMIRNAKRIFDVELPNIIRKNNYAILFRAGYSIEEVQKITKSKISRVKESHKNYSINKNSENNMNDVVRKYDKIIQENDEDLLIKTAFMKIADFAEYEKCAITTARNIQFKIRQKIFMNPLYVIGMDPSIACDPTMVCDYIEGVRKSRTWRNCTTVDAIIMVYEKTMQLLNAYVASYDKHADIMIGDEPIPESVSDNDKDAFMTLITNRFNFTRLGYADRKLNHDQKYVTENNGSVSEYILAFMMIDVDRATRLKANYRRSINSEVATTTV